MSDGDQTTVTANYTVPDSSIKAIVLCTNTAPITITLPSIIKGEQVVIARQGTGAVVIDGDGELVHGALMQNIPLQGDTIALVATDWGWVVS